MSDIVTVYSRDIYFTSERAKIVFSVFKLPHGAYYMRIGKHFYSYFDEAWIPTKEGITVPLNINTSAAMFDSLVDLLSVEETKHYLKRLMNDTARTESDEGDDSLQ